MEGLAYSENISIHKFFLIYYYKKIMIHIKLVKISADVKLLKLGPFFISTKLIKFAHFAFKEPSTQ